MPGRATRIPVYPRVGGGTPHIIANVALPLGLSPRGRGNRSASETGCRYCGSIPAWAGEPLRSYRRAMPRAVYPRVGGGTPRGRGNHNRRSGLSPRGRGNLGGRNILAGSRRSIPAWAGEPPHAKAAARFEGVYPRVGGGTRMKASLPFTNPGLSPRGRGNQPNWTTSSPVTRSIPAWAGEPPRGKAPIPTRRVYPRVGGGTLGMWTETDVRQGLSPRGRGNRYRRG